VLQEESAEAAKMQKLPNKRANNDPMSAVDTSRMLLKSSSFLMHSF
jgi:hypothetical protein